MNFYVTILFTSCRLEMAPVKYQNLLLSHLLQNLSGPLMSQQNLSRTRPGRKKKISWMLKILNQGIININTKQVGQWHPFANLSVSITDLLVSEASFRPFQIFFTI